MKIDQKQIPPEVVEAAAIEVCDSKGWLRETPWTQQPDYVQEACRNTARAAIAEALSAWPGVVDHPETPSSPRCLWLPLSTEARDGV